MDAIFWCSVPNILANTLSSKIIDYWVHNHYRKNNIYGRKVQHSCNENHFVDMNIINGNN
jgi:hypothetical protein